MINASQIRAARAVLGLTGQELADKCDISLKTLRRYESQEGVPVGNTKVLIAIKAFFESAGIEFTGDPQKNPGVIFHLEN